MNHSPVLPTGILLAAGRSQRFGSNKLLHPIKNNTNDHKVMLLVSLEKLTHVLSKVLVVISPALSHYRNDIEKRGARVVVNEHPEQGMARSLVCGIRASDDAAGWLIALADMPAIKTQTIELLSTRLTSEKRIIAPQLSSGGGNSARGHPVVFSHHYKDELLALKGDRGAREIIRQNPQFLELVPVEDGGVLMDIDYRHQLD